MIRMTVTAAPAAAATPNLVEGEVGDYRGGGGLQLCYLNTFSRIIDTEFCR